MGQLGPTGIVICSKRGLKSCAYCRAPYTKLCDYPVSKGKTCDRPMCDAHTAHKATDEDYCRDHRERAGLGPYKPKPAVPGRMISAKFAGQCSECRMGIEVGDQIWWYRDDEGSVVTCSACVTQE